MAKYLLQALTKAFARLRVEVVLAWALAPVLVLALPSGLPWRQVLLVPLASEAVSLRWKWQLWLVLRRVMQRCHFCCCL